MPLRSPASSCCLRVSPGLGPQRTDDLYSMLAARCGSPLAAGAGYGDAAMTPVTLRVLQPVIPVPATDGFIHLAYAATGGECAAGHGNGRKPSRRSIRSTGHGRRAKMASRMSMATTSRARCACSIRVRPPADRRLLPMTSSRCRVGAGRHQLLRSALQDGRRITQAARAQACHPVWRACSNTDRADQSDRSILPAPGRLESAAGRLGLVGRQWMLRNRQPASRRDIADERRRPGCRRASPSITYSSIR